MHRLGNLEELPLTLRKQLRHKAAKPGPEAVVIEALKDLDGIATTDELLVKQYRLHKSIPVGRRQFTALLYRMAARKMIDKRTGRTGLWALSNEWLGHAGGKASKRMKTKETLFDVVAVNLETGVERHIDTGKTERNAEAIVSMAVMSRGVDEEFFKTVPAGTPLNCVA